MPRLAPGGFLLPPEGREQARLWEAQHPFSLGHPPFITGRPLSL